MTALAVTQPPLAWKPSRGARTSNERIRDQARLQVEGRQVGKILYEFSSAGRIMFRMTH